MNLLEIVQQRVAMRKVGPDEYHGPCPRCGSSLANPDLSDRFSVHLGSVDEDYWFCRNCGHGDTIAFLMEFEGMSYPEACKEIGRELPEQEEFNRPKFKPAQAPAFTPREITAPAVIWVQHATKFLDWCHHHLIANPEQLAWLAARGLDLEAVEQYRLGWNPGENGRDCYRARESWGLDTILKDDGTTKKKLWLPVGLVIPCFTGDILHRLRIRRLEGEPRYYLVPGSSTAPMILGSESRAFTIIESELDAMLIHRLASDLIGAIAQGNSTAKPDTSSLACLRPALAILIALDSDEAGMLAAIWWKKQFPQAERHPVPVGKDPGEAYKAGINIREWIKSGLPPVFTLPKPAPNPVPTSSSQDNPGAVVSAPPPEKRTTELVHALTAKDGRTYHITDDPMAYARLVAEGWIVFSSQEITLIKQTGADQAQASRFLDAKQTFPGIKITDVVSINRH